ncbi:hypothetical protein C8R43DRAFT_945973 [Mycena crocata]|nr:hypothetical protein C8R43DRAFT_945973 [Mycena crocata]
MTLSRYLNQMRVHQDGLWVHPDVFRGCTQIVCGCIQMSSMGAPRWSVDVFRGCTQIVWMSSMGAPRSSVDVFRGCTQMVRGYFQSVRNDRVSSYPELERKNKNEIQQPVLCVKLPFPPWVQNKPPRKGPGTRFYFSTPRQGPPYGQKKPDFSARAARGPSVTIWVHPWTSRWVRPAQHFLGAPRFLGAGCSSDFADRPKSAETRRPARRGNIHDKHFSFSVCASSGNRKGKKCIGGLERALDSIKLPASRRQGRIDEELTPGQEEWVMTHRRRGSTAARYSSIAAHSLTFENGSQVTSHLSRTPGTPNCAGTPIDGRLLKAFLLRHVLEVVVSVNGCWRGGSGASKRARARVAIAELQMKAEVYELWPGAETQQRLRGARLLYAATERQR